MKKDELEAILGDGENTPDLGPIEDYLHAIATEADLPDFAIGDMHGENRGVRSDIARPPHQGGRRRGVVGR